MRRRVLAVVINLIGLIGLLSAGIAAGLHFEHRNDYMPAPFRATAPPPSLSYLGVYEPSSPGSKGRQEGSWDPPPEATRFRSDRTHFESMKTDPQELFLFLWENRAAFKLNEEAHTRVL